MNNDDYSPSSSEMLTELAYQALIAEAEATPKPGLVDRANSGAHTDMNIRTFRVSAAVIRPYFLAFAERSEHECDLPVGACFAGIRTIGKDAESAMLLSTGGVNTHKGAIFSLGILVYTCARLIASGAICTPERACATAKELVAGIEDELKDPAIDTHGARVFRKYGTTGIRGEAAKGFPGVLACALPAIRRTDLTQNDRILLALMQLIANVDDTNVLVRTGMEGAAYAKSAAKSLLATHTPGSEGFIPAMIALDADFTARNISPGGCADLVSAAWFLDSVQRGMVG